MVRTLAAAVLLVAVAACGGPAAHSASPVPSPSHSSAPSTTPTASASSAPDDETVDLVTSGFGAYDLEVYPVSVLHSLATAHTAIGVVVRFTVQLPGGSNALSSEPVSLAPGETLAVTVQCTDSCDGATGVDAAVTVGGWVTGAYTVISGTSAPYTCGSPCSGNPGYEGSVSGTLSGQVPSGRLVTVTAVCQNGSSTIVGGGSTSMLWVGGASANATVPVLVTTPPASCQLYATDVS